MAFLSLYQQFKRMKVFTFSKDNQITATLQKHYGVSHFNYCHRSNIQQPQCGENTPPQKGTIKSKCIKIKIEIVNLHLRILSNCIRETFTGKDADALRIVELIFWFKFHSI